MNSLFEEKNQSKNIPNFYYFIPVILYFIYSIIVLLFIICTYKNIKENGINEFYKIIFIQFIFLTPIFVSAFFFNFLSKIHQQINNLYIELNIKINDFFFYKELLVFSVLMIIYYLSGFLYFRINYQNFIINFNKNILVDLILFFSIYLFIFCIFCIMLLIFFNKNMNRLRDFIKTKN
jgi:hypothetical protein